MKNHILAILGLLAASSLASADYVLIVANLNAKPPAQANVGGQMGIGGGNIGVGMGMQMGSPPVMAPMPGMGMEEDADESPDLLVAVLEVKGVGAKYAQRFALGQAVNFTHKWGGPKTQVPMWKTTSQYDAFLLADAKGNPIASVSDQFAFKFKDMFDKKDKPTADAVVTLARWALERGLVDECAKVMDKLVELKLNHTALPAYQKVKPALDKAVAEEDMATKWKGKLLETYKVTQTDKHHFAIIHPASMDDVKHQLTHLEHSYRAFYYWWALRGVALPVPKERQIAIIADKNNFTKLKANLGASPILVDSFHARREGISVISSQRGDDAYDKLEKRAQALWTAGYDRQELLSGDIYKGIPKDLVKTIKLASLTNPDAVRTVIAGWRTVPLLLKTLENEWEQTGISHKASREMLFATKLLPRNVNAPEWIQFGMGSFFEVPRQSPWASIGAPNPYWLPRFLEIQKAKKYETSPLETLKKTVTDSYFREKPRGLTPAEINKSKEANFRKGRAAAWRLTYYLANKELPRLERYFKELAKQPRDMELDGKVLWACFQKAFAGEDLGRVANRWDEYIRNEKLEASLIHEKIRDYYKKMTAPPPKTDGGSGTTPGKGG